MAVASLPVCLPPLSVSSQVSTFVFADARVGLSLGCRAGATRGGQVSSECPRG